MAVFKCKMCGGSLEVQENMSICECVYCGTKQTLPRLNDERRANLYDRANHFRRNNEFDKAMSMYEQILEEDKEDSEAYWSLVLCTYGIEYVEDPVSRKRLPTVNRTQFVSIYADENYKAALQYADGYQRQIYETEAGQIDGLQKQILSISNKEEPFDVFICYKETDDQGRRTQDSVLANDLYHQLTNEGFKVFFSRITLEDKLGSAYEPYIFAALNSAKVMIVLGTRVEYFNAVWVRNEWSRYLALTKNDPKKVLIPAYKDMDPYDLPQEFSHLQAQDMSKLGFMQDLIRGIKKLTSTDRSVQSAASVNMAGGEAAPLLKRAFLFLEDGDFTRADEFCERVLDMDPENGEAYLGKLMASLEVRRREDLAHAPKKLEEQEYYHKIIRFGKESLKDEVKGYNQQIKERLEEEERQRAEEERQRAERESEELVAVIKNASSSYLAQRALGQLRQIGAFSDRAVRIKEAEDRIAELKEAERMKRVRLISIGVIAGVILLGIMFIIQFAVKLNNERIRQDIQQDIQQCFQQAEIWDIIPFGRYEQDGYESNGGEEIEWIVIDKDNDGNLLLFSKYVLDVIDYEGFKNASNEQDRCWATSDLRIWINDTFYKSAFSDIEAAYIKPTTIKSDISIFKEGCEDIEDRVTEDNVFALSWEEVARCFKLDLADVGMDLQTDVNYLDAVPSEMLSNSQRYWYDGGYGLRTMVWSGDSFLYITCQDSGNHLDFCGASSGYINIRPAIWVSTQP